MRGLHYPFQSKINPVGLGFVAALHIAAGALVMFMPGGVIHRIVQPDLKVVFLPKLEPEQPKPVVKPTPAADEPMKLSLPAEIENMATMQPKKELQSAPYNDLDTGNIVPVAPLAADVPVTVAAKIDPRHAAAMQPPYPPSMQRLGAEGFVSVRVLIGTDGRVKDAAIADSSGQSAFEQAALEQARRKWRFTPATKDGVAVESWQTLTVRFRMID